MHDIITKSLNNSNFITIINLSQIYVITTVLPHLAIQILLKVKKATLHFGVKVGRDFLT